MSGSAFRNLIPPIIGLAVEQNHFGVLTLHNLMEELIDIIH